MALPQHLKTGLRGEQLAARYLIEKSYTLVAANYVTYTGEIDIIAIAPDGVWCFTEVKTRSKEGMFPPSDAVDSEKQNRLISSARTFIKQTGFNVPCVRFDIIEVILTDLFTAKINHIKDAFGQGEIIMPGEKSDGEPSR